MGGWQQAGSFSSVSNLFNFFKCRLNTHPALFLFVVCALNLKKPPCKKKKNHYFFEPLQSCKEPTHQSPTRELMRHLTLIAVQGEACKNTQIDRRYSEEGKLGGNTESPGWLAEDETNMASQRC